MPKIHKSWTFDTMVGQEDDYYRCCFGRTHVNKYVYAISAVGILSSALILVSALCAAQFFWTLPPLVFLVIFGLAYVGMHQSKPFLYIPLIVAKGILVVGSVLLSIYLVGLGAAIVFNAVVEGRGTKAVSRLWIGLIWLCIGILVLFFAVFLSYLTHVLCRAYSFVKTNEVGYNDPPPHPDYAVDF
ncbi:hypothetical protein M3Y99_01263200 [Aphelenchoides fujianensis]|nr:hypothetical protein M3Y99_01263200 [Aphelenchoides fujianensis]